jgi:capsular polysaccharide biosynthesis protein
MCSDITYNYAHWLSDCLPAVIDMLEPLTAGSLSLAMPPATEWQRRTLGLLGVPSSRIISISEPTIGVKDLICHSFAAPTHAYFPGPLLTETFRRLKSASLGTERRNAPEFIYMSRRSLKSWRDFTDEDQLEDTLRHLGFVILRTETMTVDQQIASFSGARLVVGPHGSAFANLGFAPPGCVVIDIVPDHMRHPWLYRFLGQFKHRLAVIAARRPLPAGSDPSGKAFKFFEPTSYSVDLSTVVERVRAAIAEIRPVAPSGSHAHS